MWATSRRSAQAPLTCPSAAARPIWLLLTRCAAFVGLSAFGSRLLLLASVVQSRVRARAPVLAVVAAGLALPCCFCRCFYCCCFCCFCCCCCFSGAAVAAAAATAACRCCLLRARSRKSCLRSRESLHEASLRSERTRRRLCAPHRSHKHTLAVRVCTREPEEANGGCRQRVRPDFARSIAADWRLNGGGGAADDAHTSTHRPAHFLCEPRCAGSRRTRTARASRAHLWADAAAAQPRLSGRTRCGLSAPVGGSPPAHVTHALSAGFAAGLSCLPNDKARAIARSCKTTRKRSPRGHQASQPASLPIRRVHQRDWRRTLVRSWRAKALMPAGLALAPTKANARPYRQQHTHRSTSVCSNHNNKCFPAR